jgi:phage shock protein A
MAKSPESITHLVKPQNIAPPFFLCRDQRHGSIGGAASARAPQCQRQIIARGTSGQSRVKGHRWRQLPRTVPAPTVFMRNNLQEGERKMGILSRFSDIMSANINAILSKAEADNADKLLEKYLRDAKESLAQVKAETAAVIAEETGLARKLADNETECHKYENYAAAAVKKGNDDDARKFLTYKNRLETEREDLFSQYARAKENSEKMRQMLKKLFDDINASEDKIRELKQKLTMAKQQEKLNKLTEQFANTPLSAADSLFDAVQKRVDAADAAMALDKAFLKETNEVENLAKKYDATSQGFKPDQVEDQLARLKAGLQKQS